jgi:hypothetical protein
MTEEIQEIEKLIKQSTELGDSLIRLARKLQERNRRQAQYHEEHPETLATLHKELTYLRSYIDIVKHEIGLDRHLNQDEAYANERTAVQNGDATPQEGVVELLRTGLADKTITPDFAVEQLDKLLRTDMPISRRIQIRETAKAAFEAGDDVAAKIRPFLKNGHSSAEQIKNSKKRTISQRI